MNSKDFRIPTIATSAEIACADGRTFAGRVFIPAHATNHAGPMRPEEWINQPAAFFPFLPEDVGTPVLLAKRTVLVVTLGAGDASDRGVKRRVAVECGDRRLEGVLYIDMPEQSRRVQDYLNRPDPFLSLLEGNRRHLLQKDHITRVIEIGQQ
jgi:hypothetical protein